MNDYNVAPRKNLFLSSLVVLFCVFCLIAQGRVIQDTQFLFFDGFSILSYLFLILSVCCLSGGRRVFAILSGCAFLFAGFAGLLQAIIVSVLNGGGASLVSEGYVLLVGSILPLGVLLTAFIFMTVSGVFERYPLIRIISILLYAASLFLIYPAAERCAIPLSARISIEPVRWMALIAFSFSMCEVECVETADDRCPARRYMQNIALSLLLVLYTFGIYLWVWVYRICRAVRALTGKKGSPVGEMLLVMLVPFYSWYWIFTRSKQLHTYAAAQRITLPSSKGANLLLTIFGYFVVALAFLQADIHTVARMQSLAASEQGEKTEFDIRPRNILLSLLFVGWTAGIYTWVWVYRICRAVRALTGKKGAPVGEMLLVMLVPFYSWYWAYTRGKRIENYCRVQGIALPNIKGLSLLFAAFRFLPAALAVMQADLNVIVRWQSLAKEPTLSTATVNISPRSNALSLLLIPCTLGIYLWIWVYRICRAVRALRGKEGAPVGEMLLVMLVPFYGWYWAYTRSKQLLAYAHTQRIVLPPMKCMNLLLLIFGFLPFALAFMQAGLNIVARLQNFVASPSVIEEN